MMKIENEKSENRNSAESTKDDKDSEKDKYSVNPPERASLKND